MGARLGGDRGTAAPWTLALSGSRAAAIPVYWALLDDATETRIRAQRPGGDEAMSLESARGHALRNLALLRNPGWWP